MKRIIPALAFVVASSAWAEGGYVGIGVGQAKVKDIEVLDFGPGVSTSIDDEDTSFKFFGGYQFNDNFAAEIAYENIGQMSVKYDDGVDWAKVEAEATSLTFSGLGICR